MQQERDQVMTFLQHDRLIEQQLLGKVRDGLVGRAQKRCRLEQCTPSNEHIASRSMAGTIHPASRSSHCMRAMSTVYRLQHGIRLIANRAVAGGQDADYRSLLRSDSWHELLSNEGSINVNQLKRP